MGQHRNLGVLFFDMENYFVYYEGIDRAYKFLDNDSDRLHFLREVVEYGLYGKEPESPVNPMVFELVKQKIDAQKVRSEQAKKKGVLGGRPPKNGKDKQVRNQSVVSQSSPIVNPEPEGAFIKSIK